ncbi:FHA domain-containing protein [uncultured Ruegeria sp.]|uniref:FHA domain-containing protein n=1 Tax=uncultured Ruegeria sp. TaxID=259304 RepID=UPI00262F9781|nr:FHA domain-containing protein [uncultured Ruegeria sp.]
MTYGISRTFLAVAAALVFAGVAQAQDGKTRAPATGLAILDCAPVKPAPEDSCLVRVPSGNERGGMSFRSLGDAQADFEFVKDVDELPGNLTLSATMVLIDLSVGDRSGRVRSWSRERDLIARVVANLPPDEKVAIYGFGNDIVELSPFSTSRSRAEDVIDSLEIKEQNTRLVANATGAIELLSQQDDVLLKNLIVITDGDEEGLATVEEISEAAEKAGVSVSALGMFWRAQGNARTTRGIDVLKRLTDPQQGLMEEVFLQNQQNANTVVSSFIRSYGNAVKGSGLIMPVGDPAPARITIDMIEPVVGQPGQTQTKSYSAEFQPVTVAATQPEEPEEPEVDDKIFGMPALYVYIGAGVLALLALLLAVLLLRRGGADEEDELEDLETGDIPDVTEMPGADSAPTAAHMPPPVAYLVRVDNGHRFPVPAGRSTLGRSSTNAVVIPDGGVSRVHAELSGSQDGRFTVSDLDSLNGTLVNDRKIKGAQRINVGDTVGLGSVRLKLVRA